MWINESHTKRPMKKCIQTSNVQTCYAIHQSHRKRIEWASNLNRVDKQITCFCDSQIFVCIYFEFRIGWFTFISYLDVSFFQTKREIPSNLCTYGQVICEVWHRKWQGKLNTQWYDFCVGRWIFFWKNTKSNKINTEKHIKEKNTKCLCLCYPMDLLASFVRLCTQTNVRKSRKSCRKMNN